MWAVIKHDDGHVHIIPVNDIGEHVESPGCWCDPEIEWIDEDTGLPFPNGALITHNSADHREDEE